jgi:hypothetical protein
MSNNKKMIGIAIAILVVGYLLMKKKPQDEMTFKGYDTEAKNSTIFIPTSETNIEYVNGNQTITNTDSSHSTSTSPIVSLPKETAKPPETKKYAYLTKTSSVFDTLSSEYATSSITAQRVEVIQTNPSGWMLVNTWLGQKWVKDGFVKENKPKFSTVKINKGDTLYSMFKGDNKKIQQVASLNGIKDVNKIVAGTNLKVPV